MILRVSHISKYIFVYIHRVLLLHISLYVQSPPSSYIRNEIYMMNPNFSLIEAIFLVYGSVSFSFEINVALTKIT